MGLKFHEIAVMLLPIIELVCIYWAYIYFSRYKRIKYMETSKIGFIQKGIYEIKGKVVSLGKTFISPLSEKKCVYYSFSVEEQKGSGKNSHWYKVIDDDRYGKFGIDDNTGIAIIELQNSALDLKLDNSESSGILDKPDEQMKKALSKYGEMSKGWIFEKELRYKETVIEEGDELYINGEVKKFVGYQPVFKDGNTSLIIADKSEEELVKQYKLYLIVLAISILIIPIIETLLIIKY